MGYLEIFLLIQWGISRPFVDTVGYPESSGRLNIDTMGYPESSGGLKLLKSSKSRSLGVPQAYDTMGLPEMFYDTVARGGHHPYFDTVG